MLNGKAHLLIPGDVTPTARGTISPDNAPAFIVSGEVPVQDVDGNEFVEYGMAFAP